MSWLALRVLPSGVAQVTYSGPSLRRFLDPSSRLRLSALAVATIASCAVALWVGMLLIEAQDEGEADARFLHRVESLRSAILSEYASSAPPSRGDESLARILADCLQLSASDAGQQRRLTKLGALLDRQRVYGPAAPAADDGVTLMQDAERGNAYVVLAAHAWIDAIQLDVESRHAVSKARQAQTFRWLQWAVAATLISALLFGLVLIRVMRHLSRQGLARLSRLEARANRDPLTGLPNRRLLQDRLEQAVQRAERRGCHTAVIVLDLDGFKPVNDTYGHAIGDVVLRRVAKRMRAAIRSEDTVCRLGGDEFVVIIGEVDDPVYAVRRARDLVLRMSRPIRHEDKVLRVGASAGLALFPDDAASGSALLELADQALYAAKHGGRGQVITAGEVHHGHTTISPLPEPQVIRAARA
ncbi:GGDEF domain-containing protein [Niveibacterium sp. 24ML]|uniref:GGDEF domain-containing protein n=1 Tax=Niveibacterium sp. 24ML TaxID=2985512 RepID=UPI00226E71E0|nr:GGDEF domain-containing protein [Niveibacterium sp. 24ML]MCX9157693.1 GGDEF domain-containing protein [Niveibacterium sp. 24ML]